MGVSIYMLGELAVFRDGQPVKLPTSKRTRALLAYLAMTGRPYRRERLCEIFWEAPDDPRGALRWSLSKIRPIVNDLSVSRVLADRERVSLVTADVDIDVHALASKVLAPDLSLKELESLLVSLQKTFLTDIDLPNQEIFQQWLLAERQEMVRLEGKVLNRLSSHPELDYSKRLAWARSWEQLEPFNIRAATQLLSLLELMGNISEIARLTSEFMTRFRNAGIEWSSSRRVEFDDKVNIPEEKPVGRELLARQKIQFCSAFDGTKIAHASVGKGTPIVKAANWLNHLEHDWNAPIWSPLFRNLAIDHQFIRYDERGNGLSDWDVDDLSFESFVSDLEAVVEGNKLEKFALLGISQGAAVSIEYAIKHPDRVTHLILFGAYAAGWRIDADEATIKEREAIITLTETGWGQDNPAYRQIFSSTFMPSANPEELVWFNEFQRLTTSPTNAARFLSEFGDIDVREQLAKVTVPTLVIHSRGDIRIPLETGRDIAASIPNAEFIGLDSDGHLLLGRESASQVFVEAVREFIARS